ncbi:sugar transferase [Sporichthya sp.]|uniref:sugar transferase n=1 Tax=Sporichthya sp. TaxID=65475 RepID=UPI0018078727|nr:sugar transferase [Sporichthya sp.]MBA3741936.1 sugar transferase [Sporichthya sp.]
MRLQRAAAEQERLVAQVRVQPRSRRQRNWKPQYTRTSVAIDLLAAISAIGLGLLVRFGGDAPAGYLRGSLAFSVLWVGLVAVSRGYHQRFIGVGTEETTRVFRAGVALMAAVAFTSYATKTDFARGYVVIAIPSVVVLSLLGRCGQRSWLHRERRRGRCVQRTVVVGSTSAVQATVERLQKDPSHGMQVVAACVSDTRADLNSFTVPVAGGLADIVSVACAVEADLVTVLPTALFSGQRLRRLAWDLEPCGADLIVCSGLTEITGGRITVRLAAFSPMLQIERPRLSGPARVVKGLFDRSAALVGLIVIAPVMVAIVAGIWARDRHNPFFRQIRVGVGGREFGMWKFRTMVVNAEELRPGLVGRDPSDGPLFKMVDDPRVTPIGRVLRRHSLDELPQLFNVMRGQMSLVGPRPPLPGEVCAYGPDMGRRLLVKPGMTGLWQVSGRADLSWEESELLDLRYVENWSLGHDFAILWRTARAVATGSGAY